jgi:C4-dicarboxylate-specific signal transduction histidine kinase
LAVVRPKMESARIGRLTLMGELTASIAHEITQPLAAIVTNGNYCLRQLGSATPNMEEVRQAIQDIVEDGNRACCIISRIRALLMKGRPEKVELQLNEIIREVVDFVRGDINQNKIALRLDLAADIPPILGDRVQLQQAFMNVVINSIEALRSMPEERRELLVKAQKAPTGLQIVFTDSGPGLDAETAERLFEPFFTSKPEGMGLGLSISRSIIQSHGGQLSNTPASCGAVFEFLLPAASEAS